MDTERQQLVQSTIKDLLSGMGFEADLTIEENLEENSFVNINTSEAGFLIGHEGCNLEALQHLARVMVSKRAGESTPFILDVNDYRKNRINYLKELSENIAQKALKEKLRITLNAMPPFERRIVHMNLSKYPEIQTESIGQDPERKIIVKAVSR